MDFQVEIPFGRLLGLELVRIEPALAVLALDLRPELTNSWAVAHGGVTMTLLDVAMAHAARSPRATGGDWFPGVVTVEMKTSFLRAAEGRLRAVGHLLHRTTTMAFTEGHVYDEDHHLCAHATATFKFLRALPTKGRQSKALQHNPGSGDTPS